MSLDEIKNNAKAAVVNHMTAQELDLGETCFKLAVALEFAIAQLNGYEQMLEAHRVFKSIYPARNFILEMVDKK